MYPMDDTVNDLVLGLTVMQARPAQVTCNGFTTFGCIVVVLQEYTNKQIQNKE